MLSSVSENIVMVVTKKVLSASGQEISHNMWSFLAMGRKYVARSYITVSSLGIMHWKYAFPDFLTC